jgi:hypothetical protein
MDNPKRRCKNNTDNENALSEASDPKRGPHFFQHSQSRMPQAFLPVRCCPIKDKNKVADRNRRPICSSSLEIEPCGLQGGLDSPRHGDGCLSEEVLDLRLAQARSVVFK